MTEQGVCPVCGSLNIDYGHIEEHNDIDSEVATEAGVYYPSTCLDCGCKFKEIYELEYAGSEIERTMKTTQATIAYNGFGIGDRAWFTGNVDGKLEQVEVVAVNVEIDAEATGRILKAVWYDVKGEDEGETSCDPSELHATLDSAVEDMNRYLCTKLRDAREHLGELLVNQAKFKAQVLKLTGKEVQDVEIPDDEEA